MFSIVQTYYISSIISFYIALQFFLLVPFTGHKKTYLSFAFLSLCAGLYQYSSGYYYEIHTLTALVSTLKIQLFAAFAFFVLLYIFISEFTYAKINKSILFVLILAFGIASIANVFLPFSLRFQTINGISTFQLPWGEILRTHLGTSNIWLTPLRILSFGILIWGGWRAILHYKKNKLESSILLIFTVFMVLSMVMAWLIDHHKIEFFYTAGFAFFFLVFVMKITLVMRLIRQRNELIRTTNELNEEYLLRQKTQEQLVYDATHDTLTKLPNRPFMILEIERATQQQKRHTSLMALLLLDIDHFKEINDSLGHKFGDEVLISISKEIIKRIRETDVVGRIGGDEFCILLSSINDPEDIESIASKILDIYQHPLVVHGHSIYVSGSIGISMYPLDGDNALDLLRNADSAMYKAKQERNSYQFYTEEMTKQSLLHLNLANELRQAVDNDEFLVYYQPQFDARQNQLIGMEALIRWKHPQKGLISPVIFIPFAIRSGLIISIDRHVMKTGVKQITQWYNQGLNPGVLAMNLTIKQMKQHDFLNFFKSLLEETKCRPEWLEFEVTEGEVMDNPEEAIHVLTQLHDLGIKIAIDDFGTGYSSLTYLKKLPINKLKIDQSFVRDLPKDSEDKAIVKAIIALATSLNLEIIAEGVEIEQQKDFLIQQGCYNIQGYLYARPMPVDELHNLLIQSKKIAL